MKRYCAFCSTEREFTEYKDKEYVELKNNSHAELLDSSHAELWGSSHAVCHSPYAIAIIKSPNARCIGNHIGGKPIKPSEYLKACGISFKNQYAVLYKSVKPDFTDHRTGRIKYKIGKEIIAPDWGKDSQEECGKGLHLSPTVAQAISFNDSNTYLACRVKISDMASLPAFAQYPDKIRVRACVPLYQVNKDGEKI